MKKFKVILVDSNNKIEYYDVLPYFREASTYINNRKVFLENIKERKDLYFFVERTSQYQFWARCEYEHLVTSWPYDWKKDKLIKIDVHEQVIMNIDVIVDILAEELKIK